MLQGPSPGAPSKVGPRANCPSCPPLVGGPDIQLGLDAGILLKYGMREINVFNYKRQHTIYRSEGGLDSGIPS